jgi:glucose-1-phosphate adenylyltransferase
MTDSNLAINFDYKAFLQTHIESGADVTMAYHVIHNPENPKTSLTPIVDGQYFTLEVDAETGKVQEIKINTPIKGTQNSCLNIYVMKRQLLIDLIAQSYVDGDVYFERDILVRKGANLDIRAYRYDGYVARIISIKSYFDENMKLLDEKNLDALFGGGQIYTKIRDDHPTRYAAGSKAKNVMAADGCIIEGEVENCVLFRGVKIAKGAKVRNSVLMQDTVIEEGADVNYIITDKNVVVSAGQTVSGTESFPVCIGKNQKV